MGLKRELSNPLTEEEADSLTKDEKEWLRSWNRHAEIPGEDVPGDDGDGDEDEGDEDYDSMNVDDLQDLLRDRGLPVSGNKQELIDRLVEDDDSDD